MHNSDTIAAIATPTGSGGIGIIRISGSAAQPILQRLFRSAKPAFHVFRPWMLHHGQIMDAAGTLLDDVLVVFMPAPASFTGEDVTEIHCHGGLGIVRAVLEATLTCGARLAERGEFTRRAFLNGRIDLSQAEAIAEMIAAPSVEGVHLAAAKLEGSLGRSIQEIRDALFALRAQACLAVDFPDEDVECLPPALFLQQLGQLAVQLEKLVAAYQRMRPWNEGALVVLTGRVNAGKSSLLNTLLGRTRALVSDIAGTTRDFLEEQINLDGMPTRLVDTAGLRQTLDPLEAAGLQMGNELAQKADLLLLVVDGQKGLDTEDKRIIADIPPEKLLIVWNKTDCAHIAPPRACVCVSARTGEGIDTLAQTVRAKVLHRMQQGAGAPQESELVPNMRQAGILQRAHAELETLMLDVQSGASYDICAARLDSIAVILGECLGEATPDEILNAIFDTFCIGK